jgi:hypothetical protein
MLNALSPQWRKLADDKGDACHDRKKPPEQDAPKGYSLEHGEPQLSELSTILHGIFRNFGQPRENQQEEVMKHGQIIGRIAISTL